MIHVHKNVVHKKFFRRNDLRYDFKEINSVLYKKNFIISTTIPPSARNKLQIFKTTIIKQCNMYCKSLREDFEGQFHFKVRKPIFNEPRTSIRFSR